MKTYNENMPELSLKLKPSKVIKAQIKNSEHASEIFREIYDDSIEIYESMFAVYLNRANQTIGWVRISQGGLSGTVMDVRLILKYAIESLASSIIICHNHPSGNKNPSESDIRVTAKLNEACKILDIKLLDHIILTVDSYNSLADNGQII